MTKDPKAMEPRWYSVAVRMERMTGKVGILGGGGRAGGG
jgi:hypothetical protein